MPDLPWMKIIVVFLVALALVMMKRRRTKPNNTKRIAEHRLAAHYLEQDPDDVEDSAPYVKRARWSIILTSGIVAILLYIGFFSG